MQWEEYVAPVARSFPTDSTAFLNFNATIRPVSGIITNLNAFPIPYADRTRVVSDGEKRAFSLSVADVNHLTRIGSFSGVLDRVANRSWWLRTPHTERNSWGMGANGVWHNAMNSVMNRGIRPALIIHQ